MSRKQAHVLVATLLVVGALLGGCSSEVESSSEVETAPPADIVTNAVFSWGDDLRKWVSEEEMTVVLQELSKSDGEATVVGGAVGEVRWYLDRWTVVAHNADHDGDGVVDGEGLTKTDPRLPAGVVYEPAVGFAHGYYLLSGPHSPEAVCMTVLPGVQFGPPADESEVAAHEDHVFAVATMMLREMGWAD